MEKNYDFFFNSDFTKILNRFVGDIFFFFYYYLGLILLVFSHIEQTTPDDPCENYGLQYGFYQFKSKIANAILRFKVIKIKIFFLIFISNVYSTAAKLNITTIISIFFQCLSDKDVCIWQQN